MMSSIQEELFGAEQYTRLCSICRGEFPRSSEFFPAGRCQDEMASYCRKCSNARAQTKLASKEIDPLSTQIYFQEKSCEDCGDRKELREFYMSSNSLDGKTSACKNCIDRQYKARELRLQEIADIGWVVYFIQDSRNNRVKIGSSDNPDLALATLQEGSSETLNLLANHESAEKDAAEMIVNSLHCLFQTHHTGNGWFEMVPLLEQYISLIQDGDLEKAELLLDPIEIKQNKISSTPSQNESVEGAVIVDGHSFPSIAAAVNATGYTAEQLKKYLQNSADSDISITSKLQKTG